MHHAGRVTSEREAAQWASKRAINDRSIVSCGKLARRTSVATGRSPSSGCGVPATSPLLTRWLSRHLLISSVTLTRPSGRCRPATKTESRTVMRWVPCASPSGLASCSIREGRWRSEAAGSLEPTSSRDQPEDVVERGYLLVHEFFQHLVRGDFARAEETAARVVRPVAASASTT